MKRRNRLKVIIVGVFLGACLFVNHTFADILISNSVPNLTTRTVYTVPNDNVFLLNSVIIAKNGSGHACCQRILRNGRAVTAFISIPSRESIQVNFDPPIVFGPGQRVQVRNGASSGSVSFNVVGENLR